MILTPSDCSDTLRNKSLILKEDWTVLHSDQTGLDSQLTHFLSSCLNILKVPAAVTLHLQGPAPAWLV